MTVLSLSNISRRFGPTVALDGVNLRLQKGEVHALIGENGAGKSTLMNVLAGLIKPDAGTIEVEGRAYAPASPLDARERGIALIHQELSLFPHLSVAENIMMGMEPSRLGMLDRQKLNARTAEVLRQVSRSRDQRNLHKSLSRRGARDCRQLHGPSRRAKRGHR